VDCDADENELNLVVVRKYGCVVEILSTELVGVLCVLSPVCEVINSEGRTTSVVCSEMIVFSPSLLKITRACRV
jgi:hypothetical protein